MEKVYTNVFISCTANVCGVLKGHNQKVKLQPEVEVKGKGSHAHELAIWQGISMTLCLVSHRDQYFFSPKKESLTGKVQYQNQVSLFYGNILHHYQTGVRPVQTQELALRKWSL